MKPIRLYSLGCKNVIFLNQLEQQETPARVTSPERKPKGVTVPPLTFTTTRYWILEMQVTMIEIGASHHLKRGRSHINATHPVIPPILTVAMIGLIADKLSRSIAISMASSFLTVAWMRELAAGIQFQGASFLDAP